MAYLVFPQYCGIRLGRKGVPDIHRGKSRVHNKNMYIVYIIQSQKDASYYTGRTDDIIDRLKRHNQGRSKYTRNKRPWKLVYTESFNTRSEAVKRENEIKRKKRKTYIEWLIKNRK